jgi:hypothetical protein
MRNNYVPASAVKQNSLTLPSQENKLNKNKDKN